jgi:hypothetical protein
MAELTVMVPLGGREIEMRKPTDGAMVVLARVSRGLPNTMIENAAEIPPEVRDKLIRNLGTLGQIVEQMIVKDDDKEWLDEVMIDGTVSAEDVFGTIALAGEKFNGGAKGPAKKAAAPVRRRR